MIHPGIDFCSHPYFKLAKKSNTCPVIWQNSIYHVNESLQFVLLNVHEHFEMFYLYLNRMREWNKTFYMATKWHIASGTGHR